MRKVRPLVVALTALVATSLLVFVAPSADAAKPAKKKLEAPKKFVPPSCKAPRPDQLHGIGVGTKVKLAEHSPADTDGERNWGGPGMGIYVGQTASVTSLGPNDASGCVVVKVDADANAWWWRARDLETVSGEVKPETKKAVPGAKRACASPLEEQLAGAAMGQRVRLGAHTPADTDGGTNWGGEAMGQWVGQEARITMVFPRPDPSGCGLVRVDVDSGRWLWRVRDIQFLEGALADPKAQVELKLPQAPVTQRPLPSCGASAEVQLGGLKEGARVVIVRQVPADTKSKSDGWKDAMTPLLGKPTTVKGVEGKPDKDGCALVTLAIDEGKHTWRARDLERIWLFQGAARTSCAATLVEQQAGLKIGDKVIITGPMPADTDGELGWNPVMDNFINKPTFIKAFAPADASGCLTAVLDIDGGRFKWRLRNLSRGKLTR